MAHFLWNSYQGHGKIHLANWQIVSMKKEYGGLSVTNLRDLNLCLLGSWVKKLAKDEGRIWKDIIQSKYLHNATNIFLL